MELGEIKHAVTSKKKKVRLAINGFGRIGREIFRLAFSDPHIDIVAVNDLSAPEQLRYILKYDTVRGPFGQDIVLEEHDGNTYFVIGNKKIRIGRQADLKQLPWKELDVDVVAECTGVFREKEKAEGHIIAGAKKVLISAPGKGDMFFYVRGVNDDSYDKYRHHILSNGSCTTNSMAAIVKQLHHKYGIKRGFFTTVHAVTLDQGLLDSFHSDMRRGRAACFNIIPTSSGAAVSVVRLIPELEGKFDGSALRVPVIDGSITDLTLELHQTTSTEEVNAFLKDLSLHSLKGIVEYTEDPIVSSDIIGNSHSGIVDGLNTNVIDGTLLKLNIWYDNEGGFSHRMVEIIRKLL